MFRSLILSATLVSSITIAQSALALPGTTSKPERIASIAVRLSDLDLQKDADVQVLLGRLERAAFAACGGDPRAHWTYKVMPRHTSAIFQKCRYDAIARAVATIGAPKLASAFAAASRRAEGAGPHLTHSGDAPGEAGT